MIHYGDSSQPLLCISNSVLKRSMIYRCHGILGIPNTHSGRYTSWGFCFLWALSQSTQARCYYMLGNVLKNRMGEMCIWAGDTASFCQVEYMLLDHNEVFLVIQVTASGAV